MSEFTDYINEKEMEANLNCCKPASPANPEEGRVAVIDGKPMCYLNGKWIDLTEETRYTFKEIQEAIIEWDCDHDQEAFDYLEELLNKT